MILLMSDLKVRICVQSFQNLYMHFKCFLNEDTNPKKSFDGSFQLLNYPYLPLCSTELRRRDNSRYFLATNLCL